MKSDRISMMDVNITHDLSDKDSVINKKRDGNYLHIVYTEKKVERGVKL